MDEFIKDLGLPLTFNRIKTNISAANFSESNLYANVYSILSKLNFITLNNDVSDNSLYLATFRWESNDGNFLITLKADFEHDIYSCSVEEVL